jgi:DNA ligase 1
MKEFAALIESISSGSKTNAKLEALQKYFIAASSEDKIWVIALFTGRKPKGSVKTALLRQWAIALAEIPAWLFEESYHTVGDLAETIALVLPQNKNKNGVTKSLSFYMQSLNGLVKATDEEKKNFVWQAWTEMNEQEIFVFNKLITGGFRIGISQQMIVNALARTTGLEPGVIAHRIIGNWDPMQVHFDDLLSIEHSDADQSKPYPFYLAYAIENDVNELGDLDHWQAEWKWDGIRGQIIKRNEELYVWSRGEELLTAKFPEFETLQTLLPNGIAIDGEIISLSPSPKNGTFEPLPFSLLQTRIGRKNITKKQLTEAPVGFIAYDLLEYEGNDTRQLTLRERRIYLQQIIDNLNLHFIQLSPVIEAGGWEELTEVRKLSREMGSEGLMLKRKDSTYQVGRKRGDWWKWKIDPLTIDAVLIYAQKGHGRRSNLYTDYTFAVRDGDKLVSFTKAYSGLTDKEFAQVDNFVKRNALEKFGPVRTVKPELVFEIAFEGIAASNRHKSGVALRFPRMSRWRQDKTVEDINTLDDLKSMLENYNRDSLTQNK